MTGASPEQVENRVTRPIEDAVASINRVRDVYSTSLENAANVTIRFEDGTDPDAAASAGSSAGRRVPHRGRALAGNRGREDARRDDR